MNESQYRHVLRNARRWSVPPLFERGAERALLRDAGRAARSGAVAEKILREALPEVAGVRVSVADGVMTVSAAGRALAALTAAWPRVSRELRQRVAGIRRVTLRADG